MRYTYFDSPIGALLLAGREKLEYIHFPKSCLTENPCLDENLSTCKAQAKLKPECTAVHEDFSFAQQRSRWMSFCSNTKSRSRVEPMEDWKKDAGFFKKISSQLEAYFKGELMEFNIDMELNGTEFQKKVWKELAKIPYGTTIAYGELAVRIGNPNASRAVGMANSKNPLPIVIPCHRVIGKDGSLTGFGGGLDVKQKLLNLEQQGC